MGLIKRFKRTSSQNIPIYFFDTYAFFEIIDGNKNYDKYATKVGIITTKMNVLELHYGILRKFGREKADYYYDKFVKFAAVIDDTIFKEASEFKFKLRERKLSYVDSIGYIMARQKGIPFLTGDKEFEDLENVEFVK